MTHKALSFASHWTLTLLVLAYGSELVGVDFLARLFITAAATVSVLILVKFFAESLVEKDHD